LGYTIQDLQYVGFCEMIFRAKKAEADGIHPSEPATRTVLPSVSPAAETRGNCVPPLSHSGPDAYTGMILT
jgi:hypothetical protein